MGKKVTIILLCGMIIFGLIIWNHNKIGKRSNIQISQNDVSMMIKEGTLTNTNVTLIIKNNSDKKVRYGESFQMEIKKNNKWYQLNMKHEVFFTLAATILDAQEQREIELNWEDEYGKLKKGTYRIIKDMDHCVENEQCKSFNVAVEFVIK